MRLGMGMGINDYDDNDYDEIMGDDNKNNQFSCFYMAFLSFSHFMNIKWGFSFS